MRSRGIGGTDCIVPFWGYMARFWQLRDCEGLASMKVPETVPVLDRDNSAIILIDRSKFFMTQGKNIPLPKPPK